MVTQDPGFVTFLLTDIEGSTALWEHYPKEMTAAIQQHDEIIQRSVEMFGGHVIKQ